jgi:hypothetical protein
MKKTIEDLKRELFWDFLIGKFRNGHCSPSDWKRFKKRHKIIETEQAVAEANCIIMHNPVQIGKYHFRRSNLEVPISTLDKFVKQKDILLYTFEK